MSNDLKAIKSEIYNRGLIYPLLESMGCHNLKLNNERIDGSRPTGDSPRGFSVYLDDEELVSKVWTRSVPTTDIYDLVSYFKFGKTTQSEFKSNLYNAKQYIIKTLNLSGFEQGEIKDLPDYNFHLRQLKKKKKKEKNEILPESLKNEFIFTPHQHLIEEGLDYDLINEFEIGFDIESNRIVFTYRNKNGDLVGFRGRATNKEDEKRAKYFPIYNFSKSLELYNLHRAIEHIITHKKVYLFEGEKSTIYATMYGHPNSVAFMGSFISEDQADLIKSIHPDLEYILCMDKDKTTDEVRKAAHYLPKEKTYAVFDTKGLLKGKESPVDVGKTVWETLLNNHIYRVFPNK